MQAKIIKTLDSAVRVVLVKDDAEWKAEFEEYGYDTDMWATYGEWEEEWRDNVKAFAVLKDEEYGLMCGNKTDRRCYGFTVDVYKVEEADGTYSFWVTEEQYEAIG